VITLAQAKALRPGDMLHHETHKNSDGTCQRWKVSGQPKVWKTRPNEVRVPVKFGLYAHSSVTEYEFNMVHREADCPHQS
jgi:hypothetical protein